MWLCVAVWGAVWGCAWRRARRMADRTGAARQRWRSGPSATAAAAAPSPSLLCPARPLRPAPRPSRTCRCAVPTLPCRRCRADPAVPTLLYRLTYRRYTRATMKAVADGPAASEGGEPNEALLVVMGEKGRSQLQRDQRNSIYATVAGGAAAAATPAAAVPAAAAPAAAAPAAAAAAAVAPSQPPPESRRLHRIPGAAARWLGRVGAGRGAGPLLTAYPACLPLLPCFPPLLSSPPFLRHQQGEGDLPRGVRHCRGGERGPPGGARRRSAAGLPRRPSQHAATNTHTTLHAQMSTRTLSPQPCSHPLRRSHTHTHTHTLALNTLLRLFPSHPHPAALAAAQD